MYRGLILLNHILLLISIFPMQSDATSITIILHRLAAKSRPLPNPQLPQHLQISPSPSPSPASVNLLPNKDPVVTKPSTQPVVTKPDTVTKPKKEPVVPEKCDKMSKKCRLNMLTACLGVEGLWLLVLNEAEVSLKVIFTVLPVNITYKDIEIPRHQTKKIDISDIVRGSSSIKLFGRNENCVIHMGAVIPEDNINTQFPTFDTYINPINGAYVIFASALIIGGTWTCFKSWKGKHKRVDGIPYKELEMEQSDLVSSVNVETADGWDRSWDDDWDEEKGVNSGRYSTTNGIISKSSSGGRRNDWDD